MLGFALAARESFPCEMGEKTQLKLRQRPQIVMDCTITSDVYMGLGYEQEAFDYVRSLRNRAMRLGGEFSVLWRNDGLINGNSSTLLKHTILGIA